jgi:hypothetical protein
VTTVDRGAQWQIDADALKQGLRDIEFLSDPGSGESCIGADMSFIAGVLCGSYHPTDSTPASTPRGAGHRDNHQHGRSGIPRAA